MSAGLWLTMRLTHFKTVSPIKRECTGRLTESSRDQRAGCQSGCRPVARSRGVALRGHSVAGRCPPESVPVTRTQGPRLPRRGHWPGRLWVGLVARRPLPKSRTMRPGASPPARGTVRALRLRLRMGVGSASVCHRDSDRVLLTGYTESFVYNVQLGRPLKM